MLVQYHWPIQGFTINCIWIDFYKTMIYKALSDPAGPKKIDLYYTCNNCQSAQVRMDSSLFVHPFTSRSP